MAVGVQDVRVEDIQANEILLAGEPDFHSAGTSFRQAATVLAEDCMAFHVIAKSDNDDTT
jgi:hypothetical protein